jgi:DNA-binding protein HU-beta
MNKQALIAKVAKDTGGTKVAAAQAIDSMIDGITRALKKGDSVTFVGFGPIKIPQRKAVRFVAGKALKSAVN